MKHQTTKTLVSVLAVSAALLSRGAEITATLTADNHYGLYYGQANGPGLTFVGRNEIGPGGNPGAYNWSLPETWTFTTAAGDHLYVLAWNDGGAAMWIGLFEWNAGLLVSNTNDWEVMIAAGANPGEQGKLPPLATVNADIAAGIWISPAASAPNGSQPWGSYGGPIPSVGSADFVWHDDLNNGIYDAHYLIFRTKNPIETAGPRIDLVSASQITDTTATLSGNVVANGFATTAYFDYGQTTNYGTATAVTDVGSGSTPVTVSNVLSGLAAQTFYHFRLVAYSSQGTNYSADQTFRTGPFAAPTATTLPASAVSAWAATVNGTVNPNGYATTAHFEYGLTTDYGTSTPALNVGNGTSSISVSNAVSGLSVNTTYHFRLLAINAGGTNSGGDLSFTTPAASAQLTFDVAADFSASQNPNGAWSFGWMPPGGTAFNAYPTPYAAFGLSLNEWRGPFPDNAGSAPPDVMLNPTDNPITVSATTWLPHRVTFHPGQNGEHSVVRWTAPVTGPIELAAAFEGRDLVVGATTDVEVYYNSTLLFAGNVNGGGPASSVSFSTNLTVAAGDTVDFIVGYGSDGNWGNDTTQVDAVIKAVPAPCTPGTALSFNGAGDYVQIPGFCSNAPTTEVTVEFWQNVSAVRQQSTFCQDDDQRGGFDGSNVFNGSVPYSDNGGTVYWDFGDIANGGRLAYQPQVSLVGTWQHFALEASQSGNFMRIYRNGILEAEKAGMTPYRGGNFDLRIGGETSSQFYIPYGGLIDEFRIWNVARTQSQIQANMNRSLTSPQSGLVAYWRFDEGAGALASDSSGQGQNGNLVGPLWVTSTVSFAPNLSISSSNSAILLSWPSPQACFRLQQSSFLDTAWVNVTNPPAVVGEWNQVILPAITGQKFYRLISQ